MSEPVAEVLNDVSGLEDDRRPGSYDRPEGAPVVREVDELPPLPPPPPSRFFYFLPTEVIGAIKARGWRQPGPLGWCRFCDHGTVWVDQDGRPSHVECRDDFEGSARWRGVNDREWLEALHALANRAHARAV